jgi:hypothetical protein
MEPHPVGLVLLLMVILLFFFIDPARHLSRATACNLSPNGGSGTFSLGQNRPNARFGTGE